MVTSRETTAPPCTICERVVYAVADAEGVSPTALTPLYTAIEPDSLNGVIGSITDGSLTFEYVGYTVTVTADETVEVLPVGT